MTWCEILTRFRALPTPLLALIVGSRFVFGLGLGAVLAAHPRRHEWRNFGWLMMALGAMMTIPPAMEVFGRCKCVEPEAA